MINFQEPGQSLKYSTRLQFSLMFMAPILSTSIDSQIVDETLMTITKKACSADDGHKPRRSLHDHNNRMVSGNVERVDPSDTLKSL